MRSLMQLQRPCNIPQKAGIAKAHIGGIPESRQRAGRNPHDDPCQDYEDVDFFSQ